MKKDEVISAFAFNTGRQIEKLIHERMDNLQEYSQSLEAKIMEWYLKSKDEDFANHFGITTVSSGTIQKSP